MANLIVVTSWTNLDYQSTENTAATAIVINTAKIISVKTRTVPFKTTGITDIVYEFPINQMRYQITLTVTEAEAAIVTAANA